MSNALGSPRPTQKSIADRMGISVGTVSRALADDPKIAEETRVLVRQVAAEMGYAPDRAAQRCEPEKRRSSTSSCLPTTKSSALARQ